MAPEVVKKAYDEKCDLWSCGVVLYMMLSGVAPFKGRVVEEVMVKIERGKYVLEGSHCKQRYGLGEKWAKVSNPAKTLIRRLLEYDPTKRISAGEALNDPWILANAGPIPAATQGAIPTRPQDECFLKRMFGRYLAFHLVPEEMGRILVQLFRHIDTKCDGVLDAEEIEKYFAENGADKRAAKDWLGDADLDMDGEVGLSEFVAACFQWSEAGQLTDAFEFFAGKVCSIVLICG